MSTPYELDIAMQPEAVLAQINNPLPEALRQLKLSDYDRIVLTGMGSSDYALIPVERALIAAGLPVWRVDAGRLLDMPELVTDNTLLWATSQSGMSGEIVALLKQGKRPKTSLVLPTMKTASLVSRRTFLLR